MKQFFITFFANLAALLFVFGGPILLLMILIVASFSVSSKGKRMISIERGSILVFDLSVNVTDSPEHATPTSPLAAALNGDNNKSVTLRHLTTALEKAAKDERIKALFLTGSFQPADFGTGFSSLKELREAILDFKQSGKEVYAYVEAPSTRDYYVASAASTIYMNPFGEMETPGLASIKTYYFDAFQKYGIDVQVTRVGKYKSAVEPFIVDKMSDADREETEKLLGDLWGDFVSAVADSRKIDPAAFQQLVDTEGYIRPESALNAKLVDKLAYFGDVLKDLGKIAPSSSYALVPLPFKQISIYDYINASRTPRLPGESHSDNVVAVLYLEGEIVDGWGDLTNIGGDRFAAELRELQRNNDIKAVVLRVNSPGGSAYASEVIQNEIIKLKEKKKPVIVSMGSYAASGGYWVSTYGDRIFAEPNTITGSIGVFGLFMDVQKLGNNFGITWDTAKTGNYADFETISRPKTPQELALAQSRVDDLYAKFLDKVSVSRGIPVQSVELIAQGRVWSGSDALNIKLVDQIGGLDQAINYAADKAGIGSNYRVKEYPEQMSFAETLALLLSNQEEPLSHAKVDPLTQQFLKIKADFKTLEELNDPLGMYARLPLGWEIR
ncbi:MAG: signal peptide peptidase SppA [Methylacidiphilales bacterium]|nr:signal peptide peptidase SppA [Candidatus Methylacidiphilales bacterium]